MFLFIFLFYFIFFFERKSMNEEGAEREGDTDPKQAPGSEAVSTEPYVGLELISHELMT